MTRIYVDADACPVKAEVYRVAGRYQLEVFIVSNSPIRTPEEARIVSVMVAEGADAADDWIAERVTSTDIVITTDTPLARRALQAGAQALRPNGKLYTPDNIGGAMASRAIGEYLRSTGVITGGPAPFTQKDRSRFLQSLDLAVVQALRRS